MYVEYESVQQTAKRLGVTERTVQKWALSGKLPGAQKEGRDWKIPKTCMPSEDSGAAFKIAPPIGSSDTIDFRPPMPLMNGTFAPGHCLEYIQQISDTDDRTIALSEYYYFSGQAELAAQTAEPYLDSPVAALRYSAGIICTFANLSRGHIHLAHFALNDMKTQLLAGFRRESPAVLHAIGIFTATTASVLLHAPLIETPPLEDYIRYLPEGIRLFALFVLAHKAYLGKNYERSLAIADTALCLSEKNYPLPSIYLHLIASIDLMNLMRLDDAQERFLKAWQIAKPDNLIEPFGELHGLLHGLIEKCFRKRAPGDFDHIITITYKFSAGWRKVHKLAATDEVADNLTTTEFTIAMLYSRGWSAKQIAAHIEVSERTIHNYIASVYSKLGINDKKSLKQFMLV